MRSPADIVRGRIAGMGTVDIARRTVPCYKYVKQGRNESLAVCLLVDSKYLYRYPYENLRGITALTVKARYINGEMEEHRLREYMPGHCRHVRSLPEIQQLDDTQFRQSSALLAAYPDSHKWIRRRTDVAEILDEVAVRWTRTLELTLPDVDARAGAKLELSTVPVPLALHSKQVLTGFRMLDGTGRRLSMLTRHEDQPLIKGVLRLMAQLVNGGVLPDRVIQLLDAIVTSAPREALQLTADIGDELPSLLEDSPEDSEPLINNRDVLRSSIGEVVDNFILSAWLPNKPDQQFLIEYSWVEAGRLKQERATSLDLDVGAAGSFHFELLAPDELDLTCISADFSLRGRPIQVSSHDFACRGRQLTLWVGDAPRGAICKVRFSVRLHRPGLAEIATIISIISAATLSAAVIARFVLGFHPAPDVAAPVLVALPAGLAALLVRETRHRLTAILAVEARVSIAATAIALGAAAVSIAIQVPSSPPLLASHGLGVRAVMWCTATLLSVLVAAGTLIRQRQW